MSLPNILTYRPVVFLLAATSFVCLLGQFYGFWSMQLFACAVFPPAIALLVWIAYSTRKTRGGAHTWIVEGAIAGIVAAIAYDIFRVPFVLSGYPLFKVFPEFGKLLLGANGPEWLVQLLGWAYHFSNGAALGIMFLAMLPQTTPRLVVGAGVLWAIVVEMILLATPYRDFFKIHMDFQTFLILTLNAHLIFGGVLGVWCRWRLSSINQQKRHA